MTLSKKRDKERKRQERMRARLDKTGCPTQEAKAVQPKLGDLQKIIEEAVVSKPPVMADYIRRETPELDADGNPIPGFT